MKNLLKQFRPTIIFLTKFLGMYILGSLLYGWYITHYHPAPDPATIRVTDQAVWVIHALGWDVSAFYSALIPTVSVVLANKSVISVYEGCNGINVLIIFWSFVFAFGPWGKKLLIFSLAGMFIIHTANLLRLVLLFFVAYYYSNALYFIHKYFFTAAIYVVVLVLWLWWIRKLRKHEPS